MTAETKGPGPARVVACVPDLMDRSKVEAAARAAGVTLALVGRPAALVAGVDAAAEARLVPAQAPHPDRAAIDLVIVDLSRPGALDAIRRLAGSTRIVGFGSHVERDLLGEAREAGCDQVMARSAFFSRLGDLLGGLGGQAGAQPSAAITSSAVIGSENIGKS